MMMLFGVILSNAESNSARADVMLSGVAYTIDPAYVAEVRDYLGRFSEQILCIASDHRAYIR